MEANVFGSPNVMVQVFKYINLVSCLQLSCILLSSIHIDITVIGEILIFIYVLILKSVCFMTLVRPKHSAILAYQELMDMYTIYSDTHSSICYIHIAKTVYPFGKISIGFRVQ